MLLEIPEAGVTGIGPSLIEAIPGTHRVRLKADAIDDFWIVVQYSLKYATFRTTRNAWLPDKTRIIR